MRCVVNFAKAAPWPNAWYPAGQKRLQRSLQDVGWKDGALFFNNELQVNSPSHNVAPYAFKMGCLNEAVKQGYTTLLWADASVFAIKPIEPIFEHIEHHGHIFFMAGFNCAQWTNDRALDILGVTRDEAEKMPMYMALCFGLDLRKDRSRIFLERLSHYALNTDALRGSWENGRQTESRDPRCQGHRHDQSVGSILAAQMGMELSSGHDTFFQYYGPNLFQYGKPNPMEAIRENVVLLAQGMNS